MAAARLRTTGSGALKGLFQRRRSEVQRPFVCPLIRLFDCLLVAGYGCGPACAGLLAIDLESDVARLRTLTAAASSSRSMWGTKDPAVLESIRRRQSIDASGVESAVVTRSELRAEYGVAMQGARFVSAYQCLARHAF
jgi:hypothetical protein